MENSNGHETYVTTRGHTVTYHSVAPLLDQLEAWRLANTPPTPTYTPKVAEGIVAQPEPHYHRVVEVLEEDPATQQPTKVQKVQTSLETEAEWAVWHQYEAALQKVQTEYATRFLKLILMRGITVEVPPDEQWATEQEFFGFTVPTEPLERRFYWLTTELISTQAEVEQITVGVLRMSGASEEVVSSMEQTFRGALGQPNGTDAGRGAAASSEQGQELVLQSSLRGYQRRSRKRHPQSQ